MKNIFLMENYHSKALLISYLLILLHYSDIARASNRDGQWQLLLNNTGVVAMHMALTHYNTVIMLDQTSSGPSRYKLRRRSNGRRCTTRNDLDDSSCYAHSLEYDVARNRIRPLSVQTDTWCSSGSTLSNGTLIQTGGFGGGSRRVRYFRPCTNGRCDWRERNKGSLSDERWYASSLRLPERDDRVVLVGGRNVFSYEFVPKRSSREKSFSLPFLRRTYDRDEGGSNLYPILHLSSDGNLFIFANRDSILFNYKRNKVVKTFPRIKGKGSRSHPSTGSSVILPLDHKDGFRKTEVMICGGGALGAFRAAQNGRFLKGSSSCGRMVITGNNHNWKMEKMPGPRLMSDMIILPNGDILIINGVRNGCAGWNYATNPALQPYLYRPKKPLGKRFRTLKATKIARMYHSSALLLLDGRVLVAGSNPNNNYAFENVDHPTELRLQAFTPPNMGKELGERRAHNVSIHTYSNEGVGYGEEFSVRFMLKNKKASDDVVFTAYASPFNTHSMSMNQRMLILKCKEMEKSEDGWMRAVVEAPPSSTVAPAGYYMLSVVNNGIPSLSQWLKFTHIT